MELVLLEWLGKPVWMWAGFLTVVVALLALDLGLFNRNDHEIGVRESLGLSAFYIAVAFAFGAWMWSRLGADSAIDYLTAYAVEKSLAMDNVFVIALIFSAFSVPRLYQHRVLFWGVLGVIVLRAIMIGGGAVLVARYHWVLYLFAGFLIITGVRMFFARGVETDIEDNRVLKWCRRRMRVTPGLHGHAFFVRAPNRSGQLALHATPLFLALVTIEFADVIFAVDSVPAVFAITTDAYVVYTSNIFAILGLRALYFALAAVIHRFAYLKQALAVLLVFIGAKVFAAPLLGLEKIPPVFSLSVTAAILIAGVVWSLWRTRAEAEPPR
ncbi:TerC family protein [Brevundimonas guildfordensis]|uniref:TerC family protein n=1 Tax=Brevundimonas guildfordensis TaxID=2762241 RepID=A0ABR8QXQ7_9CAUL|nr:TerC family protein [Brevundimonas guildfordensis]MBD7940320.1 TerC family protein [Brevundimonas guildfordensis]